MSELEILGCLTTCVLAPKPIDTGTLRHFAASDVNLSQRSVGNTDVAASDWRAAAEAGGRLAFEEAVAMPEITAEPLAWLWRSAGGTI